MQLANLFRALWFTPGLNNRWGLAVLVEGPPGTAKTNRIAQAAGAVGLPCEAVIASLREPADFLGLPIPDATGQVNYAPPSWARRIAAAGRGVVFLDELNTAPPAVQAALLRCVLEGVVGDLVLPPGIRFVAAQNAVEDAAGGYDLAAPLANRFGHLSDMGVTSEDWGAWMLSGGSDVAAPGGVDAAKLEAQVLAAWPDPYAKATGTVVTFLRSKSLLLKQPRSGDPQASKAWPSPRTWEMATRALAGAEVHGLSEAERDTLVAGFVGLGAATELVSYQRDMDLPDPSALLDGKVKWAPDTDRLDRTQAVLAACAALVCPAKADKRIPRSNALWELMAPMAESHTDLVVQATRALVGAGIRLEVKDIGKAATTVMRAVNPALRAAGIINPNTTAGAR